MFYFEIELDSIDPTVAQELYTVLDKMLGLMAWNYSLRTNGPTVGSQT